MTAWAFSIGIFALCFLVLGLIKPNWALFWMAKPSRLLVLALTTLLLMVAITLYGEGTKPNRANVTTTPKQNTTAIANPGTETQK